MARREGSLPHDFIGSSNENLCGREFCGRPRAAHVSEPTTASRDSGAEVAALRPEVAAFAAVMERVLRQNDYKGGWKAMKVPELLDRLHEEVEELEDSALNGDPTDPDDIVAEAADVANFALFIADNTGSLLTDEGLLAAARRHDEGVVAAFLDDPATRERLDVAYHRFVYRPLPYRVTAGWYGDESRIESAEAADAILAAIRAGTASVKP